MMKNSNPNRRMVIGAAVAASFLMFASGVGYRVLAQWLEGPTDVEPLSPDALARLPMQIGEWSGTEMPMGDDIVEATDTDAHISRAYSRYNASEYIRLYVAYGVKARDLMPHRPEVCYTGNGWTIIDRDTLELPLSDGTKLPCNVFQFSRGTLNNEKVIVLDYYIVDGEYCHDVSLLRSKAWRGSGAIRHIAQVQITASIAGDFTADSAARVVRPFAIESAPFISRVFKNAEEDQHTDQGCVESNGTFEGNDSE